MLAMIKPNAHAVAWYRRSYLIEGFNRTTLMYNECVMQHTHASTFSVWTQFTV
jgi:hypothetical protein